MKKPFFCFLAGMLFGALVFADFDRSPETVRRIIANPGDKVWLRSGSVYINGKKLDRSKTVILDD